MNTIKQKGKGSLSFIVKHNPPKEDTKEEKKSDKK